ncbi:transcriptional regulator, TetR family [Variovorax sp. HW608]|uniref:TetR/AcrR family transcriptional regulator n=1 Tax=Variovorax sp. HW608 TaxID=1034889 RepID=UPI00081FFD1D|nr:TetR/AcrR family transcriptional regulator [Variovorax sp. HW608]SCK55478.1 transcriptional regulator, TetR family [Variovorax sp. HW608]
MFNFDPAAASATPADPGVPPSQAQRRIHAAAMRLFAERGVTKVSISELAAAAGMARGTIYSHVSDVDGLFEEVAAQLAREMTARVVSGFAGVDDPALRLAIGVRQYIRRAHEEPLWGRFMSRFGLSPAVLQTVLGSEPLTDLQAGIASGRYRIGREQLPAMAALLSGGTLAAMLPVLDGHGTWRDVGSDMAEILLVALGLDRAEARALARSELPALGEGV